MCCVYSMPPYDSSRSGAVSSRVSFRATVIDEKYPGIIDPRFPIGLVYTSQDISAMPEYAEFLSTELRWFDVGASAGSARAPFRTLLLHRYGCERGASDEMDCKAVAQGFARSMNFLKRYTQ